MTAPAGAYNPARKARKTGNVGYDASLAATQAQADVAAEDFARDVGERLGGLNAIGALRSGGSNRAVQEAGDTYSKRVAQAAAGNAMTFAEMDERRKMEEAARGAGLEQFRSQQAWREREFDEDKRRFDLEFGEGTRRFDTTTGEDRRRFDIDTGYRDSRATRSDYESDRGFGEDTRRFDVDAGYREGRARREDEVTNRSFFEDQRRYDQDYGRQAFENDRQFTQEQQQIAEDRRRYEQERADAIEAERRRKKRSLWGSLGTLAGGVGGFMLGGPAGAAAGAKLGGQLGGG